jgi:hypothetical protein
MMTDPSNTASAERSATDSPRAARRGSFLRLFGSLLLASVVVAAIAVPWLLSDPTRTARLIASALGDSADVSVERSRVGWLQPVLIEGISITPRDGRPKPIAIGRIEGNRGLLGMLAGFGDLGRFRVEGLEVDVVFDDDRTSNLTGIFAARPPESGGAPAKKRRAAVTTEVEIEQAVVTIRGPWAEKPWISEPIDMALALEPDPSQEYSRWRVGQVTLLEESSLDPAVSEGVLAYIAPILADATILNGRFSLSIDAASLPVGDPISGSVSGHLVMHEVDIGPGPLARRIIDAIPGERPRLSSLRVSEESDIHFTLAERTVTHEGLTFGFPLRQPGKRLDVESSGSVGIDQGTLAMRLTLPLPTDMPANRPLLQAFAGKKFGLSIGGTLDAPTVDFDGTLRATLEEFVGLPARPAVPPPPKPGFSRPGPTARGPTAPEANERSEAPSPVELESLPQPEKLTPPVEATDIAESNGTIEERSTRGDVASAVAEEIRSRLPPEAAANGTTDAVVDLVSGVLEEVARRRAAKKSAEGNQQAGEKERADAGAREPPAAADDQRPRGRLLGRLRDRLNGAAAQPASSNAPPPKDAPAEEPGDGR